MTLHKICTHSLIALCEYFFQQPHLLKPVNIRKEDHIMSSEPVRQKFPLNLLLISFLLTTGIDVTG